MNLSNYFFMNYFDSISDLKSPDINFFPLISAHDSSEFLHHVSCTEATTDYVVPRSISTINLFIFLNSDDYFWIRPIFISITQTYDWNIII